jgi:hypothetical protein
MIKKTVLKLIIITSIGLGLIIMDDSNSLNLSSYDRIFLSGGCMLFVASSLFLLTIEKDVNKSI